MIWHPIQGVSLPFTQYYNLWIHGVPDLYRVITEDERMDELHDLD